MDANRLDIHGERVYYMPEDLPDVKGIRFLRTGLLLGELKKNRFEPSQALAMCLKKKNIGKLLIFLLRMTELAATLKAKLWRWTTWQTKSERLVSCLCRWISSRMGKDCRRYFEK